MRNLFKSGFKSGILLTITAIVSLAALKAEAALLVASRGSNQVLRYDDQTGAFIDVFISDGVDGPAYLTYGPDGNLYVADYYSSSVLRYSPEGKFIDVFIPPGSGGLVNPETIKFGSDGNLYVSGPYDPGLQRYDGKTGAYIDTVVATVPSTGNSLFSPDFALGPDNNIYISSVFPTGGVLKYDQQTKTTSVFIPPSSSPEIPGGEAFGPDGNLYVGDFIFSNASIRKYDSKTGALLGTFVQPGSGGLSGASRLSFEPDGNLYVSSFGSNSILRYNGTTGAFVDAFVPSGSGGLNNPIGFLFTRPPVSVPEPTSDWAIFGVCAYLGASAVLKSKQKKQRSANL